MIYINILLVGSRSDTEGSINDDRGYKYPTESVYIVVQNLSKVDVDLVTGKGIRSSGKVTRDALLLWLSEKHYFSRLALWRIKNQ